MVDIVRVNLKNGVKRFPLLTVKDQLSFLLTSADMEGKTPTEQQVIVDEILDILYPGYTKTEQEHIFIRVYCASFGKNAIKVSIKSTKGLAETFMVIHDHPLEREYQIDENLKLIFDFPRKRDVSEDVFLDCIRQVEHNGELYEWVTLDEGSKNAVLDMVGREDVESIISMLITSCRATIRDTTINTLLPLFKILFNKAELNEFFKTNYLLNKNALQVDTMMSCSPMERQIYVAMLADDLKKQQPKG